ncbi:MAG: DUF3105 domain-containing protein [Dehalococcoidia bacterium]|nr:DUF3105 domain-containing protein [Dehalococcoidia bacterium]
MQERDDLYQLLEVEPAAKPEGVEAAYKRVVDKYRVRGAQSADSARVLQRVKHAYDTLKDPIRRAAYDRQRAHGQVAGITEGGRPQATGVEPPTRTTAAPSPPPRREEKRPQTPVPTEVERRRAQRKMRKTMRRYFVLGVAGFFGILIILALVLPSVSANKTASPSGSSSGSVPEGPGTVYPFLGRNHVPQAQTISLAEYNSVPPTSGPHWPIWERCGVAAQPVPIAKQVHNLEHGFVLVQYSTKDQAVIDELERITKDLPGFPNYYLIAPYADMPYPIALTAWRVLLPLDAVDEATIREFAQAYRAHGPEPGAPSC